VDRVIVPMIVAARAATTVVSAIAAAIPIRDRRARSPAHALALLLPMRRFVCTATRASPEPAS